MLVTPHQGHSVVVYHSVSECSESGDFIIYNDTDISVDLVSNGWGHTDLLNPPTMDPWTARADIGMDMKGDPNYGTLHFNIRDPSVGYVKFSIWAHTDGVQRTYFTFETDDYFVDSGTCELSKAIGIHDSDEAVAQIYHEQMVWADLYGYVVTLYAVNNKDNSDNNYNGNTKVILTIMRNDQDRFRLGGVTSTNPSNWYPSNTKM